MFETQWSKMQRKCLIMPNTILTLIGDEKLFSLVIWYNRSQKPMISENALSYLIYFCSLYNQISNTLPMRTIEQASWSIDDLNHFPNYIQCKDICCVFDLPKYDGLLKDIIMIIKTLVFKEIPDSPQGVPPKFSSVLRLLKSGQISISKTVLKNLEQN